MDLKDHGELSPEEELIYMIVSFSGIDAFPAELKGKYCARAIPLVLACKSSDEFKSAIIEMICDEAGLPYSAVLNINPKLLGVVLGLPLKLSLPEECQLKADWEAVQEWFVRELQG